MRVAYVLFPTVGTLHARKSDALLDLCRGPRSVWEQAQEQDPNTDQFYLPLDYVRDDQQRVDIRDYVVSKLSEAVGWFVARVHCGGGALTKLARTIVTSAHEITHMMLKFTGVMTTLMIPPGSAARKIGA